MPDDELPEKQFIHEEYKKNPYPLGLWLLVMAILMLLLWFSRDWLPNLSLPNRTNIQNAEGADNFNHVTNREFSLFLWQNPAYMRVNLKKTGYLPAFQILDKITVEPDLADRVVVAPPEILFLYHAWARLLGADYIARPILESEFKDFIDYCEEWQPEYWSAAPKEYVDLYAQLMEVKPENKSIQDLQVLSIELLPLAVRKAFQGWKNNFIEAKQINAFSVNFKELEAFLNAHPHYDRNFWKNILEKEIPDYLISIAESGEEKGLVRVSANELAPFLKIALFNFHQTQLLN